MGEILIGPKRSGDRQAVSKVREFFATTGIEILAFNASTAEIYSDIRTGHKVSAADAVHLACAAQAGVDLFLTNDKRLKKLVIPGIQFVADMRSDIL